MPTATNSTPFYRGRDVTLRLTSNGKPVYFAAKSFQWEQVAVEAADGVNGEDRDRLDLITNYFQGTVDIYAADQTQMQMLLDQQTNDDASGSPFKQTGSVRINHRDGTRSAFKMIGMKIGPWTKNLPGRTEIGMLTLKFRFTRWEQTQSI